MMYEYFSLRTRSDTICSTLQNNYFFIKSFLTLNEMRKPGLFTFSMTSFCTFRLNLAIFWKIPSYSIYFTLESMKSIKCWNSEFRNCGKKWTRKKYDQPSFSICTNQFRFVECKACVVCTIQKTWVDNAYRNIQVHSWCEYLGAVLENVQGGKFRISWLQ